jgi:hypothetical protein
VPVRKTKRKTKRKTIRSSRKVRKTTRRIKVKLRNKIATEAPDELTYQWCAVEVNGSREIAEHTYQWAKAGWKSAPLPNDGEPYSGQVLMQRPASDSREKRRREIDEAHRQHKIGLTQGYQLDESMRGTWFPYISPVIVSDPYITKDLVIAAKNECKQIDGRAYVTFPLTIGLMLTDSEIETALALKLDLPEYGRRKFMMRVEYLHCLNSDASSHSRNDGEPKVFEFVNFTSKNEG